MARLVGCRVYNSSNISISNASATTVTFDSEDYDDDSMHDTGTNTDRITITVAGRYRVTFNGAFATNGSGVRYAVIKKNGTDIALVTATGSSNVPTGLSLGAELDLSVSDYLTVDVWQNSGGALNLQYSGDRSPYFSAHRIG